MGAFRNDDDLRQHRIENLEREIAQARWELEKKNEEIAELQDKENSRVNFYLGYNEDQVAALERENKELHQQVILLRGGMSPELSMAISKVARADELTLQLKEMRREVRRTRLLVMLMIVAYWFTVGGWLPL